jgi:hypothetical protein
MVRQLVPNWVCSSVLSRRSVVAGELSSGTVHTPWGTRPIWNWRSSPGGKFPTSHPPSRHTRRESSGPWPDGAIFETFPWISWPTHGRCSVARIEMPSARVVTCYRAWDDSKTAKTKPSTHAIHRGGAAEAFQGTQRLSNRRQQSPSRRWRLGHRQLRKCVWVEREIGRGRGAEERPPSALRQERKFT